MVQAIDGKVERRLRREAPRLVADLAVRTLVRKRRLARLAHLLCVAAILSQGGGEGSHARLIAATLTARSAEHAEMERLLGGIDRT